MQAKRELGEFLRARRSQLRPAEVGLRTHGDQRRVSGLRREELALLAGVSEPYYARLEQGVSANASPEVLDAIASALLLSDVERQHLHELAAQPRKRSGRSRPAAERVTAATRQLVATLDQVPVVVLGRRGDVLAWNVLGHALFAGHVDRQAPDQATGRPNMARLVFLDPHIRELYADWRGKARAVVATLRKASGRYPDDPAMSALVGELSVKSGEFAAMWADHRVKAGGAAVYEMRHPLVGAMTVTQQVLRTETDQQVVLATTEIGSPSHAALTMLIHAVTTHSPTTSNFI